MRRALIVLVALVSVVVVAALVVPTFIDWNPYKADLAARVEAETGRVLAIDGDLDFRLLPAPQLSARQARLSNIAGADAAEMISVSAIDIRVAFLPLLGGDIKVERIGLVDPVVTLERLADGRPNWIFEPPGAAPADTASPEPAPAGAPTGETASASDLSLDALEIENGTVTYRDAASGTVVRLDRLNAIVSADSLAGPFAAEGDAVAGGVRIAFDLGAGAAVDGRSVPINLELALPETGASIRLDGRASELGAAADVTGQLAVSADSARGLGAVLAAILGSAGPRLPDEPFALRTRIAASAEETALNEMLITLGEARATGAVSAAYAEGVQVDVALSLNRLDLDRWLAPGESGTPAPAAPRDGAQVARASTLVDAFALPDDFSGSFNLQVDALTYNGGIVRQLSVSASALDGVLDISRAAALLPGGSDVTVSGSLAAGEDGPEFRGRVEAASDNLRAMLAWLAVDTTAIPADRLRKAVVGADIGITRPAVRLSGIDLRIDSSRIIGAGSFEFGERPSLTVDLAVDRFNADAYRPIVDPDEAATATAASEGVESEPAVSAAPNVGAADFDADVMLRVGEFTFNRTPAKGLNIDLSLADGVLVVREAVVGDVGGGSVRIDGRARDLAKAPVFTGTFAIEAEDPTALFQLAEIETTAAAARLGPLRLAGTFETEADAVAVDIEGSAGETRVRVRGSVGTASAEAPMSLVLELTNPSLAALIGQVTPEFDAGIDGAVALTGTVAGPPQALDVALHADVAGAKVSVAGTMAAAEPTAFDLTLGIEHEDMTRFLGDIGIDYRPAAVNLGGLEIDGKVAGEASAFAISEISGSVGPVAVIGALEIDLGGERPRVAGNLRTSEIIVDLFLPVPGSGPAAAVSAAATSAGAQDGDDAGQGRWSTDPIDLEWLDAIDGEIALASSAIDYGRYRFVEPSLRLVLDDGALDIAPLTGTLYGGAVEITARLEGAGPPRVALALRLDDADLLQALIESAQIDRASGRLAVSAELSAEGANQFELISSLAGSGRFSAREGSVRGVDLRRLSNRLRRLNEITDYLGLIQASLSGGETTYSTLDGTFRASEGIFRSDDLRMTLDGGEAEGAATVDLPRWGIDLRARARLVEHPEAPGVGLDVFGSLDSPQRDLRIQDLERYLAARVGGAVLRKLLPDALTGDEGAPDPSSGSAPAGGDAVESLLKGLLDRLGD